MGSPSNGGCGLKKDSVPRARAKKRASASEQAGRVDTIVGLMQRQEWDTSHTARLAADWKVSTSMVDQLAAEASRRCAFILSLVDDPKKLADEAASMLVRTMHQAYDRKNHDGVIRAADVVTKIKGARVAEKSELTIHAKELEHLPPAALLARIRDQRARLDEAERKLLDEHPELAPKLIDSSRGATGSTAAFDSADLGSNPGATTNFDAVQVTNEDGTKTLYTTKPGLHEVTKA